MKRASMLAVYMCLIYICLFITTTAETESPAANKDTEKTSATANKDKKVVLSDEAKLYGYFSSQNWCADATTVPIDKDRCYLSGIRLIFEPNFGFLFQRGKNEFDSTHFPNLSKIAFETNIHKGWAAVQLGLVAPSTIKFDPISPVIKEKSLINGDTVKVKGGITLGLSFLDGWISAGWGALSYNSSSYVDCYKGNYHDAFLFVNLQPVSLVKSTIKAIRLAENPENTTKELKEAAKESKDTTKESKEAAKESKEAAKESKEAAKESKEAAKELKEAAKELKEATKELKEAAKELKEAAKESKDKDQKSTDSR